MDGLIEKKRTNLMPLSPSVFFFWVSLSPSLSLSQWWILAKIRVTTRENGAGGGSFEIEHGHLKKRSKPLSPQHGRLVWDRVSLVSLTSPSLESSIGKPNQSRCGCHSTTIGENAKYEKSFFFPDLGTPYGFYSIILGFIKKLHLAPRLLEKIQHGPMAFVSI